MNKKFLLSMLIASQYLSLQAIEATSTTTKTAQSGLTGAVPMSFAKDVTPPMNAEQTLEENLKKAVMAYTSDKDATAQTLFIKLATAYFNALQTISLKVNPKETVPVTPVAATPASKEVVHEETMPVTPSALSQETATIMPSSSSEPAKNIPLSTTTSATEDHMNALPTMPAVEHENTSSEPTKTDVPSMESAPHQEVTPTIPSLEPHTESAMPTHPEMNEPTEKMHEPIMNSDTHTENSK